jgi:hypothetical protein
MNIEAYRRELQYEKNKIPLEERASREANLLAETIKLQVQKSYELALTKKSSEEAAAEVREAIERDIVLVAPDLQEEIKTMAMAALDQIHAGGYSALVKLDNVEDVLLKGIKDRHQFLNEEGEDIDLRRQISGPLPSMPKPKNDSGRWEYSSKAELLESLVSDRENSRWVSTSNVSLKSDALTTSDSKISLQVKVQFLGVALEAGPSIVFKRQYETSVNIMAEGLNPVLSGDGHFDFSRRDKFGNIVMKNGQPERRLVNMTCDVSLNFESEYSGSGGFSVAGVGGSSSISRSYKNAVTLQSRRVMVPSFIDNKTVTYRSLRELCHNDFLKARVTNNMTVASSLNMMMKNVVSSLRFSHPKTKCAIDSHCYNWFNKEIIPALKLNNFPRCVEESREKYQTCAVYDKQGNRLSDGMFEYECDTGLRCVKYQEAGWFKNWGFYQYAKGKCMPVNPNTYKNPFEQAKRESRVIDVYIVN